MGGFRQRGPSLRVPASPQAPTQWGRLGSWAALGAVRLLSSLGKGRCEGHGCGDISPERSPTADSSCRKHLFWWFPIGRDPREGAGPYGIHHHVWEAKAGRGLLARDGGLRGVPGGSLQLEGCRASACGDRGHLGGGAGHLNTERLGVSTERGVMVGGSDHEAGGLYGERGHGVWGSNHRDWGSLQREGPLLQTREVYGGRGGGGPGASPQGRGIPPRGPGAPLEPRPPGSARRAGTFLWSSQTLM